MSEWAKEPQQNIAARSRRYLANSGDPGGGPVAARAMTTMMMGQTASASAPFGHSPGKWGEDHTAQMAQLLRRLGKGGEYFAVN